MMLKPQPIRVNTLSQIFIRSLSKGRMMNYFEWAEEYSANALRVRQVIEKKKSLLNDRSLSADARKALTDRIIAYRVIYRELLRTAEHLRKRGEAYSHAS